MSIEALLMAPAAIGVLTAVLGLLISATDAVVNNYGEVDISINSGKKDLKVKGGSNLLLSLAEQSIFLPSACGGRGSCGACKVQVDSDVGPHLPTETPYLTKVEMEQNIRLACQIKLKANIEVQIPEALFNIRKLKTKVAKIVDVTHDIKEVLLDLPEDADLNYEPGQYGQFEVPAYDKIKEPTMRAYSFSSNPTNKKQIEFLIRLVPGGIVTTYVHKYLKEGQTINVVAPVGDFHVHKTGAQMICVAGGSGMAPFKSIFNNMIDTGEINEREVWYFFGARTTADIFYLDWLRGLEKKYSKFHFVPALSEPQAGDGWDGETGLITDVLGKYLTTVISEGDKEGYLCGSPGMLDACMNVMRKNNMKEDRIFFDKFA